MSNLVKLLKAALKIGLKTAVPVLGELAASLLEEGASIAIDTYDERARDERARDGRAWDVVRRLLATMQEIVPDLAAAEGLDVKSLSHVTESFEQIVMAYGIGAGEWSLVGFDPQRATREVLERAKLLTVGWLDTDRSICTVLLNAFHVAFLRDRETCQAIEADFRAAVFARLDRMPTEFARELHARDAATLRGAAAALIEIPSRPWRPDVSPPGALLRADTDAAVPFHGRDQEIEGLMAWCGSARPIAVRLFTGAGGMGKTRLLIEACRLMRRRGWAAGFVDRRAGSVDSEVWRALFHYSPLLIVVDYAENQRALVAHVLRHGLGVGAGRRVRVVLLARAAEDWWDEAKGAGDGVGDILSGPATDRIALKAVAPTRAHREESYQLAARTFAAHLGKAAPTDLPADLDAHHFMRILLLHMQALASVEGVSAAGDQPLLDYVLQRERRFWTDRAASVGLPAILAPGIAQAMAAVTLGGGAASEAEALDLFRRIPVLADQPAAALIAIARVLHDAYPGAKWIEPVLPDLLGEHLVQTELATGSDRLLELVFGAVSET